MAKLQLLSILFILTLTLLSVKALKEKFNDIDLAFGAVYADEVYPINDLKQV